MLFLQFFGLASMLFMTSKALAIKPSSMFSTSSATTVIQEVVLQSQTTFASSISFEAARSAAFPSEASTHVTVPYSTASVQTDTSNKNVHLSGSCNALYNHHPSFKAAASFAAIFGILTIAHITQAIYYMKAYCYFIIMASLWEFLSFTLLTITTETQQSVLLEHLSSLFVLTAHLWLNVFLHLLVARLIYYYLPTRSLYGVGAPLFALLFLASDVTVAVLQVIGGNVAGKINMPEKQMMGVRVYIGGIALQEVFIVLLMVILGKFYGEVREMEIAGMLEVGKRRWRWLVCAVYANLGFISIRVFYRLAQFFGGKSSSNVFASNEAYFYVFEAVPMALSILLISLLHPGRMLIAEDRIESVLDVVKNGLRKIGGRSRGAMELFGEDEVGIRYTRIKDSPNDAPEYSILDH